MSSHHDELFALRVVNCKIHLRKETHIAGFFLAVDLTFAKERREEVPFSRICKVIDDLIRRMNWNTPDVIIPPGTLLRIVHGVINFNLGPSREATTVTQNEVQTKLFMFTLSATL